MLVPMWPFFAPSRRGAIDRALTLAGLSAGERFVDLGCGDGRVLVAAARRGARVTGIEVDGELVAEARARLARGGFDGEVIQGDILTAPIEAEVIFTYLTPGTLQEMTPRFQSMDGTRLVTLDFQVPDLVPDTATRTLSLYRLPAAPRTPEAEPGWPTAATLVVTVPERQSLTCLEFVHPGGPVTVDASPELTAVAAVKVGRSRAAAGAPIAVDLRWEAVPDDTVVVGTLRADGVPDHHVIVLFADEEGGQWDLNEEAARQLVRELDRGLRPRTSDELLAAAVEDVA